MGKRVRDYPFHGSYKNVVVVVGDYWSINSDWICTAFE